MRARRTITMAAGLSVLALSACGTVNNTSAPAGGGSTGASAAGSAAGGAPGAAGGGAAVAQGAYVNVVKLTGIAWFDRMKTGVEEFGKESGKSATQTGPATNSPELQVGIIQGLIAKKPSVLAIIPSDPGSLDAVIKQATGAGVKVITQEAPELSSPDADIEAFENAKYGQAIMKGLGGCMKGQGQYVQFVGSLTAATHMEWSKAALEEQKKSFSGMSRIGTEVESNNNADVAYQKTKQLLQANPKLTGFAGASSEDVIGIARAIREAGLQNDTCVYGTGVPSQSKQYLTDGSIDEIYFWDPSAAGKAMLKAGQLLVDGKKIATGTDLGVEGYTKLTQSPTNPKMFTADAMLTATKDTVDKFPF
ncbi:substrate-binding domain-containing protein [Arsenicicoccus dermatophilus]|uniref:substrate-binding domain-containing protein n=1 Tax=Arsenicicoccus dermatophilus TaxID=1076331 RepID=UPI001F4CDC83|nr:substrate-binding domain-containing protein [Arsenicicoccus dermatophilus]MCH8613287.1 substrate-binding domain-containing protein [Arsenicicoccus dermatophilus]